MNKDLSLGAKIWMAVGIAMGLLIFTLVFATARQTSVQTRSDQMVKEQTQKLTLALKWSGLTETNVNRVLASNSAMRRQRCCLSCPNNRPKKSTFSKTDKVG